MNPLPRSEEKKARIISSLGLRFRFSEKIYPLRLSGKYVPPRPGSYLVVDTSKGIECGEVVIMVENSRKKQRKDFQINKILRQADVKDLEWLLKIPDEEENTSRICMENVTSFDLPVKIVKTHLSFDQKRTIVYYEPLQDSNRNKKLNLKEVIKALSKAFNTRVEFTQLAVRQSGKVTGGLGSCGKSLCCGTWLNKPKHTTVKMAKEQGIPINVQKLNGVCGRLQCCIQYEADLYTNGKINDIVKPDSKEG